MQGAKKDDADIHAEKEDLEDLRLSEVENDDTPELGQRDAWGNEEEIETIKKMQFKSSILDLRDPIPVSTKPTGFGEPQQAT